jgi:hypothetical protein
MTTVKTSFHSSSLLCFFFFFFFFFFLFFFLVFLMDATIRHPCKGRSLHNTIDLPMTHDI